jgi:hypothetical protein
MSRVPDSLVGIGWAGIFLGVILVMLQARFLGSAVLDLAFRLPPDPMVLLGDVLILGSSLILICSTLKPCRGS